MLTSFIALVGMRDPAEELRAVRDSLAHPWRERATLGRFVAGALPRLLLSPQLPVRSPELTRHARALGRLIHRFGLTVAGTLVRHREAILDRQLVQEPIAEAAMELYASACVLSRRDAELSSDGTGDCLAAWEHAAAALFLRQSARRIREALSRLGRHDNAAIRELAKRVLESG